MLDQTDFLLQLQNTADSGPSPFGVSFHSEALRCGKKAQLNAANKALQQLAELDGESAPDPDGAAKLSYLRIGIHLHKLMECRFRRQLGADAVWDARADVFNQNFREALRLYRGFHTVWGTLETYLGCEVIGAEVPMGLDQDRIRDRLGGPLTGRADAIINVVDPERAHHNTGLFIMPGRAILDYKSGRAHQATDEQKFTTGLQAQAYLWLDSVDQGPEHSACSIVFLRMVAHKTITQESFKSFQALPVTNAESMLRNFVTEAMAARERGTAMPTGCYGDYGDVCWFLRNGQCNRA